MSLNYRTSYEWTLETLSQSFTLEDGTIDHDIIDSDHRDATDKASLDDFRAYIGKEGYRVGIVRDTHDKRDGDLIDRLWAYFGQDGKLDTQFRNASGIAVVPVPLRFLS